MNSRYQYKTVRQRAKGWISKALHPATLSLYLFLASALAVTAIILTVLSSRHAGFILVEGEEFTALGSSWDLALLWTSLPNLVFAIMASYWGVIAAAVADREPFVELSKPHPSGGVHRKKSIMLDYRVKMQLSKWVVAFRNGHFVVGLASLLVLVNTLLIVPLSAHLITPRTVLFNSSAILAMDTAYNGEGLNSTTDWKPVFDKVAATKLYRGSPYPWTDNEFAFASFSSQQKSDAANFTVSTQGYSAYLDCQEAEGVTSSISDKGTNPLHGKFSIRGVDRGCSIAQEFDVSNASSMYLQTTSEASCSVAAFESRLVFTGSMFNESSADMLENVTFISCIPSYAITPGLLRFSPKDPEHVSFQPTGQPNITRHLYWRVIEQNIFSSTAFNLNSPWMTTDFGSLILYLSQQSNPSSFLSAPTLKDSIKTVFTSVYLTATAMNAFERDSSPASTVAIASVDQTRLFMVRWVSGVIDAFLLLCIICAVAVWYHVHRNSTILTEEPEGLLSAADILHRSNLFETIIEDTQSSEAYEGKLIEAVKNRDDFNRLECVLRQKSGYMHPVVDLVGFGPKQQVEENRNLVSGARQETSAQ
ncbi:hypothetical protein NA57DRAFT_60134 [Rhizodiscina lignyota]|uniref:Uncharacterized protein n=1 Tax=Rhizodiscina lignyota TaxID=1504668 RepID=A0A9P4I971_9PEZI|nr:hypothetical protein NA57DRAFT_60134 [Rhizodiscina lignyota]